MSPTRAIFRGSAWSSNEQIPFFKDGEFDHGAMLAFLHQGFSESRWKPGVIDGRPAHKVIAVADNEFIAYWREALAVPVGERPQWRSSISDNDGTGRSEVKWKSGWLLNFCSQTNAFQPMAPTSMAANMS